MTNLKFAVQQKLAKHFDEIKNGDMRDLFLENPKRAKEFSLQCSDLFLDYSKNRITKETLTLLSEFATVSQLKEKIEAMFSGKEINFTEKRAVLHTALRNRSADPVFVDGKDVMPQIKSVLNKMRSFSDKVRSGEWKGYTGKAITDIVNIGIGGSDLGPKMVCEALKKYGQENLHLHFVSNIDGTQMVETLKKLRPESTLFIVASKTFTTQETLTNAETARDWLLKTLHDKSAVEKHFVAISTNAEKVKAFGIDTNNMFEFWDWVGGRYSVWSAIGLSIVLLIGMDQFEEFLLGAHEMDIHFRESAFDKNMPVILALIGMWYRNFYNATSEAVIPYDDYLKYFMAYLQQMDMESNGKSVCMNGQETTVKTGPVVWGGIGTDCQHSFHQLLHQGTDLIPVDFIIPLKSLNPIGEHHTLLYANCLAQAQALLQGKTLLEAQNELIEKGMPKEEAEKLASFKVMPGNRPSNMMLLEKLTPKSMGALIALYEHKVFVQGILWDLNSFDQWGVELGKQLASKIGPYLKGEKEPKDLDASTMMLIEKFKATHKNQ